ncbi:aminotransferase class III-fold pyridoxal phosphate-dependent enzyme [Xylanimonas allomyrinae]|uniref:Aminotransferase class III-fold pyridoxal phosphate-dependent enzyme n=1 Tax=Xylanimonas allomyrinae TaxID=2509459 RepID=A0A4V0YEL5_9MICO|nr:aminotransferase class III-fold pyridoxal phosphate-dependent enzyme [Xylanimonas allomyrinae]QAY64631.1 aminotransferase class III-fold pyridoxal phosphate-dependent enzyme [Xylanimonas allomyrinae]
MTGLRERRERTLGPYAPLFYDRPLELVGGDGVWLTDVAGGRYLDAYNNVPHVGHAHPRVVEAIARQAATLNLHTRYLNDRVVDYAERLLATFDAPLDRVVFTNSGSESNDLALRIAAQHTSSEGVLVSDFSYHGHTRALAAATTGLRTREGLGPHVRTLRVPDLDGADRGHDEATVLAVALDEARAAIDSLRQEGHGLSALLFDSLFSTEGLNRVPAGYVAGLAALVRGAGGLVVGDEVQSGFGRTGTAFWGYQNHGVVPDLVTMGKPMGNGHPVGGVALSAALLDEFGPRNMYFNTFGGNPVSAAAGLAVLDVLRDEDLVERARATGVVVRRGLERLVAAHERLGPVKGTGLFFGVEILDRPRNDPRARPDPASTRRVVEALRARHVLVSRIGREDSVLKMRPPMPFGPREAELLLDELAEILDARPFGRCPLRSGA